MNDLPAQQARSRQSGRLSGEVRVTSAMEDYLKAAYRLEQEGGAVTTLRMAEELGLSGPSVTNMVKRLDELKLVVHNRYHGIALTPSGRSVALEVIRHHRLLERYLVEALGFSWDEVHAEAERLEHHLSEELEARLDAALGHPTVDPHGDPIPSHEGAVADVGETRLSDLTPGEVAVVRRVSDRDPEQLRYLAALSLVPGAEVRFVAVMPFEGPIRIVVNGAEHAIGRPLATAVYVDRLLDTASTPEAANGSDA